MWQGLGLQRVYQGLAPPSAPLFHLGLGHLEERSLHSHLSWKALEQIRYLRFLSAQVCFDHPAINVDKFRKALAVPYKLHTLH